MSKIELNSLLCSELRNKINEYQNYSINKTHSINNAKTERGWDKICAIMDRLDDTTLYLNSLDLKKGTGPLPVFDFYNFMNNSATLIDCINFLGQIFDYDFSEIDKESDIFNQKGNDGSGTDKKYFEYLRSLCSIHPIETSRHKIFQDDFTKIECSPFVRWNDGFIAEKKDCDLIAIVYINNPGSITKYVYIKLEEIFKYIIKRFNVLNELIKHIDDFYKNIENQYRKNILKNVDDFADYCDYLEYLKEQYSERIQYGWNEHFDFYIHVMKCKFSNPKNQEKLIKYQNAIKYGFTFFHKYLQELPQEDTYETTGIHVQPEHTKGDSLFWQLQELPREKELYNFSYAFEKLSLMWLQPHYMDMANALENESKAFWEKYVIFEKNMTSIEISILFKIAGHFYKLEHNKNFQNDIPNTKDYRI